MSEIGASEIKHIVKPSETLTQQQSSVLEALKRGNTAETPGFLQIPLAEMVNVGFLRGVADLKLPFEIALAEHDGQGIVSRLNHDAAGLVSSQNQEMFKYLEEGKVSIHTHLGQRFEDLCPSDNDIASTDNVNDEGLAWNRLKHQKGYAAIINDSGILVFGFDPNYKELEEHSNNLGQYSWKLKNQCIFKWEELKGRIKRSSDDKRQSVIDDATDDYLAFLNENGIIKLHKRWDEVTDEDLAFLKQTQVSNLQQQT